MQDQMTIQTTRLDYKLNLMALQSDYRFLQVTVKEGAFSNYNKLIASWLPEAVMTPRRNMYVLMFRQLPLLQQVIRITYYSYSSINKHSDNQPFLRLIKRQNYSYHEKNGSINAKT